MSARLYALELHGEADVLASRHAGRQVAVTLGMDDECAERVATWLGERSRDAVAAGGGSVVFELSDPSQLHVVVTVVGAPDVDEQTMRVALAEPVALDGPQHRALTERLPGVIVRSALDELLTRNRELEEANRNVRAQYDELADELETTNQGVVALYAELDDKSRQLREASDTKTRFLNNISHELRTPGNSVLGLARLLLDPDAERLSAEQRQQVEFIHASAEDLLRLVNELLDLAKAESGRIEPVNEPVDLGALFDELRGTLTPLVTTPGVTFEVRPPEGVEGMVSDVALLRHLLRNLLTNAIKFTETGSITMTGARSGGRVVVCVRDTGIGITPEDQPRVFEEFYQVRGRLQTQSKGSGLGLPFARRLAGLLGGELRLESMPGEGTTMSLDVPLHATAPRSVAQKEERVRT